MKYYDEEPFQSMAVKYLVAPLMIFSLLLAGGEYLYKRHEEHIYKMQHNAEYRERYLKEKQEELEKKLEDAKLWRERFEKNPWAYAGMR